MGKDFSIMAENKPIGHCHCQRPNSFLGRTRRARPFLIRSTPCYQVRPFSRNRCLLMGLPLAGLVLNVFHLLKGRPNLPTLSVPSHRALASPPLTSAPSIPLRRECLEVVQRASPIEVAFVDARGGHREHPHLGATHEDGKTFGYVPDETWLQRDPPPFRLAGDERRLSSSCAMKDDHYKMLRRVVVGRNGSAVREIEGPLPPWRPRVKILCTVYTVETRHGRIPAILETWGQRCDGFIAASNKTDPTVGAVNIPHEGPEIYKNMWQKVRSIWSFLYDNFYDKYDWFHIGGDDMYVITENLRQYLESDEIRAAANGGLHLPDGTETAQVPLYLGRQFANRGKLYDLYNSGGPGYTLNRAALKTLVVLGLPKYYTNTVGSVEDIMVGRILRKFNVLPYDTRDNSGGDRYMHFSPAKHYVLQREESQNITSVFNDWYRSISGRVTPDSTAARCIAFHYLKTKDMQRMHALLYGYCGALLIRASGEG